MREQYDSAAATLPPLALIQLLSGIVIARAIQVVIKLEIADVLKYGPMDVVELARSTGAHAGALYRLLRALASINLFTEVNAGCFAHTQLSMFLRSDVRGSVSALGQLWSDETHWSLWYEMETVVRTGQPVFERLYGVDFWQYSALAHPELGELFNTAMTNFSEAVNVPVASAYDFTPFQTLVDVGGGYGSLLATIIKLHPHMRGGLLDTETVIEEARPYLSKAGVEGRCALIAGDFFDGVPAGADLYVLKQVLQHWDDNQCVHILRNCRRVMKSTGRVLVVEQVLAPGKASPFAGFYDLYLMTLFHGRMRTEEEFRTLFDAANLRLTRVIRSHSEFSIIEGAPM